MDDHRIFEEIRQLQELFLQISSDSTAAGRSHYAMSGDRYANIFHSYDTVKDTKRSLSTNWFAIGVSRRPSHSLAEELQRIKSTIQLLVLLDNRNLLKQIRKNLLKTDGLLSQQLEDLQETLNLRLDSIEQKLPLTDGNDPDDRVPWHGGITSATTERTQVGRRDLDHGSNLNDGIDGEQASPARRNSVKKGKSPFESSAEGKKSDTGTKAGARRPSIEADVDVADYHAIVNGLTEPYDKFLWRGSVCIPAPTGVTHGVWYPVKIKLDTGSDFNIISRRVLKSLQFRSGYDDPVFKTAITLDASHAQEFNERVSLSFTFDTWQFTLYETFYISDRAEIDLLIGHETITAENLLEIHRNVVNHLRWRNRSKIDRAEMEANRKKAIVEADNERAAALKMLRPTSTPTSSSGPSAQTSQPAYASGALSSQAPPYSPAATPTASTSGASTSTI